MRSYLFRHLRIPIAAVTLVLTILAITASPISAHWDYQEQGKDVAITSPDHDVGSVCDVERDGNFVTAVWEDSESVNIGDKPKCTTGNV